MPRLTDNPLYIDSDCRQASCHFDINCLDEGELPEPQLKLPPQLENAVQKRKAEFRAGRYCAAVVLAQLGYAKSTMIGIGPGREPQWPEGVVGSITHASGYASAVAAKQQLVRGIGIDSEAWIDAGTARELGRHILTATECHDEQQHLFASPRHHLTMVFSAKESLYKCLFPLVGSFFGFQSARIIPSQELPGTFRYELLEDLNAEFRKGFSGLGTYRALGGMVHTAIVLKPAAAG